MVETKDRATPPDTDAAFVLRYRRELEPSRVAFRVIVSVEDVTQGRTVRFPTLDLAFDHIRTTVSLPPPSPA